MVITYAGGECFKVTQGDLTLAFNPPAKGSEFSASKFGSDIVLVSLRHKDFDGIENASFGDRAPFVIAGPGEYEVKGVAVRGFASETSYDSKKTINTIYSILLDNMNLCFLGALSAPQLPQGAKQELDGIDILFLPIGGKGVLNQSDAYALAVQLEPKIIVPMHYEGSALSAFLKEAGVDRIEPQEKLTLKKKDVEGKEGEIVILAA